MRHDRTRPYRIESLAKDGTACATVAAALVRLIALARHEAAQASDQATADALKLLADDLCDAGHGPISAMEAAHEAATDEEGTAPFWTADAELVLTLGLRRDPRKPLGGMMRAAE